LDLYCTPPALPGQQDAVNMPPAVHVLPPTTAACMPATWYTCMPGMLPGRGLPACVPVPAPGYLLRPFTCHCLRCTASYLPAAPAPPLVLLPWDYFLGPGILCHMQLPTHSPLFPACLPFSPTPPASATCHLHRSCLSINHAHPACDTPAFLHFLPGIFCLGQTPHNTHMPASLPANTCYEGWDATTCLRLPLPANHRLPTPLHQGHFHTTEAFPACHGCLGTCCHPVTPPALDVPIPPLPLSWDLPATTCRGWEGLD